ncbi:transglycosylase domain-containing protein [Nocardioides sp. R-C-SC26]|uniref:transglycosylase domain-containing protein n=1 Tax=Nocardioides sp. R-C-SC26 TaxID=2870414 RepID=UPI001E5CE10D|nr:transglycosylase domain-containing protein [Nocardioides sp. R-C-SC26]
MSGNRSAGRGPARKRPARTVVGAKKAAARTAGVEETRAQRRAKAAKGRGAKRPKQPLTWKQRVRKGLAWGGIGALVMALIAVATFVYFYKTIDIPEPNSDFLTETTYVYYADGSTPIGSFSVQKRDFVPLDEMADELKDAVVAAENRSFWTDRGIDPKGIIRAAFNNASGNSRQGASTITQQYVKILYLSQDRSYRRKIKEAILSLKIQRELSKQEVLEGYLNLIYFGRGAYGTQAAAQAYFGVDASDLNLRQSAVLAAVLNDPNDLDPANGRDARLALRDRYDYVLSSMASVGAITSEKAEKASKKLPGFVDEKVSNTYGGQNGHALTLVKNQVLGLTKIDGTPFTPDEVNGGGLRITTTLTEKNMSAAEEAVRDERPEGFSDRKLHIAVASVEPGTGALRGFYGGQDFLRSQINWAVSGGQAGSTFKPFALAAALKDGYSLRSTFDGNSPLDIGGTEFENQGNEDYGSAVSLLTATQKSVNTAYIDLTNSMGNGPQKIIDMSERLGIPPAEAARNDEWGIPDQTPGLEPITGVALGSQTVSPINMANAYATIANGGMAAHPYVIERVEDADGDVLYDHKVETDRAIGEDIASDVSYALQQVVTPSGSGFEALQLGRPAAGKTGTATNGAGGVSSAWFVGYTPQLATAVMYVRGQGNEQLKDWLPSYFGGAYPARTWTAAMGYAMEGLPEEDFPEPAFVEGDPPEAGHEPYTPPPRPTRTPKPTKTPDPEPTQTAPPSPEPTPEPTPDPEPTFTPPTPPSSPEPTSSPTSCGLLGCPSQAQAARSQQRPQRR